MIDEYLLNVFITILSHFTAHGQCFVIWNSMLISVVSVIAKRYECIRISQISSFSHRTERVITFHVSRAITNIAFKVGGLINPLTYIKKIFIPMKMFLIDISNIIYYISTVHNSNLPITNTPTYHLLTYQFHTQM